MEATAALEMGPEPPILIDLLPNIFAYADGHDVLSSFAVVCRQWREAAKDVGLWSELVWRRWLALNPGVHTADGCVPRITLDASGHYSLAEVYFRLSRLPSSLKKTSVHIEVAALSARFTGRCLGGNQTVSAWPGWTFANAQPSAVHPQEKSTFSDQPPFGILTETCRHPWTTRASLSMVRYFEVTIGKVSAQSCPVTARTPCVAVGLCNESFPLEGKMPGWDSNSLAYHGYAPALR